MLTIIVPYVYISYFKIQWISNYLRNHDKSHSIEIMVNSRDHQITSKCKKSLSHQGTRIGRTSLQVKTVHKLTAKISLIGDKEVGKTTLLHRFITGDAGTLQEIYIPTLGADFQILELASSDSELHLYVWDMNGSESFKTLRIYYLHGTNAFLLLFDLTRPETLDHAYQWRDEVLGIKSDAKGIMIGMKLDLERQVDDSSINRVAADLGCDVILASAKTGENCKKILRALASLIEPSFEAIKKRGRDIQVDEDLT